MRNVRLFRHHMSSTVLLASRSGLNAYGEPAYGADVPYRAHIARGRRIVRTAQGQEVVSGQAVYLDGAPAVQETDRITLSTGDVGSTENALRLPTILRVDRLSDGQGPHHTVVHLG